MYLAGQGRGGGVGGKSYPKEHTVKTRQNNFKRLPPYSFCFPIGITKQNTNRKDIHVVPGKQQDGIHHTYNQQINMKSYI